MAPSKGDPWLHVSLWSDTVGYLTYLLRWELDVASPSAEFPGLGAPSLQSLIAEGPVEDMLLFTQLPFPWSYVEIDPFKSGVRGREGGSASCLLQLQRDIWPPFPTPSHPLFQGGEHWAQLTWKLRARRAGRGARRRTLCFSHVFSVKRIRQFLPHNSRVASPCSKDPLPGKQSPHKKESQSMATRVSKVLSEAPTDTYITVGKEWKVRKGQGCHGLSIYMQT